MLDLFNVRTLSLISSIISLILCICMIYVARTRKTYNGFKQMKEKASSLYSMPERCRVIPELKAQNITQYQELIEAPWRIIFRIVEKKVYVLSVLDSRRNIEDILLERVANTQHT